MEKYTILIAEDENIIAKDIERCVTNLGYTVCGIANTAESAIKIADDLNPNLILMDIRLKGKKSGIDAAKEIREKLNIPIVYLTAYADDKTLEKAKITEPYGYILKPFKDIDIKSMVEIAIYKHQQDKKREVNNQQRYSGVNYIDDNNIYIRIKQKLLKVNFSEILFIEALKDYVMINTEKTRYTIHSTMKDLIKTLPKSKFIRVHRSYIVNREKIHSIEPNLIKLEVDKKNIPVGASFKNDLFESIRHI
jgi:two-component system response regulator LytT